MCVVKISKVFQIHFVSFDIFLSFQSGTGTSSLPMIAFESLVELCSVFVSR